VQKGKKENLIREDLNEIPVAVILWMQLIGFLKIYQNLRKSLQKEFDVTEEQIFSEYCELIFKGIFRK